MLNKNAGWHGGGNVGLTGEISAAGLEVFVLEHFSLVTVDCQWSLISTKNRRVDEIHALREIRKTRDARGSAKDDLSSCRAFYESCYFVCINSLACLSPKSETTFSSLHKIPHFYFSVILLLTPQKYSFDTSI